MDGHPIPGDYTEPPPPFRSTLLRAAFGAVLSGIAFAGTQAAFLSAGPAALLASAGMIVAGASLTLDPRRPALWALACLTSVLSAFGYSPDWDSMRLFAEVVAGIAVLGLVLSALPTRVACYVGIAWLAFHFAGILSAVTLPPPQPWLSVQLWSRYFRPYLSFIYMNNAYQFYSPDPGPASELWWCVMYEKIDPTPAETENPPKVHRWIKMPNRSVDFRDPLGMVYFRRLALTEQLAQGKGNTFMSLYESEEIQSRRSKRIDIHDHPELVLAAKYRPPAEASQRFLLPAFAAIPANQYPTPDPVYFDGVEAYKVKSVYMYRVEHQIVSMNMFVGVRDPEFPSNPRTPMHPWDQALSYPWFMGEYVAAADKPGEFVLKDSADPLLFWIVPILPKPDAPAPPNDARGVPPEQYFTYFDDNVATHAGSDHRLPDGGTSGRKRK